MLCGKNVLPHKESDDENEAHVEQGTKIQPVTVGALNRTVSFAWESADVHTEVELEDERTCISLTIVDTPGFGDDIDNEARWELVEQTL
jgi:cell division control protein 11